jgi:hypothetical protein
MKPQTKESLSALIEHACKLHAEYEVAKQSAITFDQLFYERESDGKIMRYRDAESIIKSACFPLADFQLIDNKIKGIYLFSEKTANGLKPVYIGISRNILQRLKQHCYGKSHYQASLEYRIQTTDQPNTKGRNEFKLDEENRRVKHFYINIIPIEDDYSLYFLEVAIAGLLNTPWNHFKTH